MKFQIFMVVSPEHRPSQVDPNEDPVHKQLIRRRWHSCLRTANSDRCPCFARHWTECRIDSRKGNEVEAPRNMVLVAVAVITVGSLIRSGRGRRNAGGEGCWIARKSQGIRGKEDGQILDREHSKCFCRAYGFVLGCPRPRVDSIVC